MADTVVRKKVPRIPVATPHIAVPATSGAAHRHQNSLSTPTSTSSPTAKSAPAPVHVFSSSIGSRFRITNILNHVTEGTLWAVDDKHRMIVICEDSRNGHAPSQKAGSRPQDFHLIWLSKISKAEPLGTTTADEKRHAAAAVSQKLRRVEADVVIDRIRKAVVAEKKTKERLGKGVGKDAQDLYDALARTLPLRWREKSIIVLDSIQIDPPYTPESCRALEGRNNELARVKKVLDYERKKLFEKSATVRKIPNFVPNDMRKGG